MAMLLKLNEVLRDGIQIWQDTATTLGGYQHIVAYSFHFAVLERPGEDTALSFHCPFADGFVYQKVE
jgi:hypothetical protein